MYYHVIIETNKVSGKNNTPEEHYELDRQDPEKIVEEIIVPYLQEERFQIDGYFVAAADIKRLVVRETKKSSSTLAREAQSRLSPNIIYAYSGRSVINGDESVDITRKMLDQGQKIVSEMVIDKQEVTELDRSKVFIVHGHDDLAKTETARFVELLGFVPIILHEQASGGKTIIEKIEEYSNVGFGIVLYTPCDVGGKNAEPHNLQSRARQNVVFEHGFLNGKLGRHNVCALVKGALETPNDISGVVYVSMDENGAWKIQLAKEMRSSGYDVDMNKII